jgi:serine/threonine protein phosphatase PrpC
MDKRSMEAGSLESGFSPQFVAAGRTDIGSARPTNQDAFLTLDAEQVWAVADGMGGYRDGDVASRMVCDALAGLTGDSHFDDAIETVNAQLSAVNERLYKAATRIINPVISGSTVAVLVVRHAACAAIWAGDSRIYRLRSGRLTQMTTDHTWAAELNLQSTEETDHAITRAVGGEGKLLLDVRRDRVLPGDRYLLCTDGLTHELADAHIGQLLAKGDVAQAADALIRATLEAGARDNVTVVVIDAR